MRISLDDHEERRQQSRRLSSQRRRRSASRVYDSAVTTPAALPKEQIGVRSNPARGRLPVVPRTADPRQQVVQPQRGSRRQSLISRALVALLLLGLIVAIAYASVAEPFFVSEVQVTGNRNVSHEAIMQAAQVEALHIFWVRPQEIAARVGSLNGVRSVRVRCALPGRVMIDVQERQAVVRWHVDAQHADWWIDEDGVVLPYPAEQGPAVVVHDLSGAALQAGGRLEQPGLVAAVQQLASALPEVTEYYYNADTGLSFLQRAKGMEWPVYVGDGQDLPRKLQALQALNSYFAQHSIRPRYVDVRWPEHPVYGTPKGSQGSGG